MSVLILCPTNPSDSMVKGQAGDNASISGAKMCFVVLSFAVMVAPLASPVDLLHSDIFFLDSVIIRPLD